MYEQAELHFEGRTVYLELLDTIVSKGRKESIAEYLDTVLNKRFQIGAEVRISYKKASKHSSREEDEERLQLEINEIFRRRTAEHREEDPKTVEKKMVSSKESPSSEKRGKAAGKKEFKKKEFYRPLKQGDDPNLLYGRNFEDEPIPLEQVITEIGRAHV